MRRLFIACAAALVLGICVSGAQAATSVLSVSSDFPNGSGKVLALDQEARKIAIVPTPHPGRGWECWWYIKVSGITPGETIAIEVGEAPWATPDRATFSIDQGKSWQHTQAGKRAGKRITYAQKIDAAEALIAWGPPFTPADAQELVRRIAKAA